MSIFSYLSRHDLFFSRSRFLKLRLLNQDFDASRFLSRLLRLSRQIEILRFVETFWHLWRYQDFWGTSGSKITISWETCFLKLWRFSWRSRLTFGLCRSRESQLRHDRDKPRPPGLMCWVRGAKCNLMIFLFKVLGSRPLVICFFIICKEFLDFQETFFFISQL